MKLALLIVAIVGVCLSTAAASTCSMFDGVHCPLAPVYQNNTFCAHDAANPWCQPPPHYGAITRCVPLPAGSTAQIKPGCSKCDVRFVNNNAGNIYNWCADATDGCIYVRYQYLYNFGYYCASSPDATTPIPPTPIPQAAPVPVAPVPVPVVTPLPMPTPVQAPVPVAPVPTPVQAPVKPPKGRPRDAQ